MVDMENEKAVHEFRGWDKIDDGKPTDKSVEFVKTLKVPPGKLEPFDNQPPEEGKGNGQKKGGEPKE